MANVLSTSADLQRYASACVRYGNENSDFTFKIEFHNAEEEFERQMRNGAEPDEARKASQSYQYYTYRRGNEIVIHVPNPTTATTERDAAIIKSGILHEILHTTEGTHDADQLLIDSGMAYLKPDDPLRKIWNTVEDHRIERLDCAKFAGDARVLSDAYRIITEEHAEYARTKVDFSQVETTALNLMGLKVMDLIARESWMMLDNSVNKMIDANPEHVHEVASRLIEKGYDSRTLSVETVEESLQLAKDIFEELFEENPEQHIEQNKEEQPQQAQQGNEGGDEEGEGEGSGKGDESKKSAGEGDGDKVPGYIESDASVDYLEHLDQKKAIPSGDNEASGSGTHIDYSRYLESQTKARDFDPCPMDNIGLANFGANVYRDTEHVDVKQICGRREDRGGGSGGVDKVFRDNSTSANSLANKIRRLLQVQSQARWVGGATQGRIHRKSAYRAAMPTVGDGRWNREIFKKRHQDQTLDVAVSILCDFSGSMGGPKMAHASFGGYILSDAIGRVLKVPTQVTTFSEMDTDTIMCVLKNWNETVTEETYIERVGRAANTMEQNDDGSAILWAYEDLRRRQEKRKVLVVLSDGSPASSRDGDAMGYTKQVVKAIEEEKLVEIYGIGIMDRNVNMIYTERETINSPDEIEPAILNTVKRKLVV